MQTVLTVQVHRTTEKNRWVEKGVRWTSEGGKKGGVAGSADFVRATEKGKWPAR